MAANASCPSQLPLACRKWRPMILGCSHRQVGFHGGMRFLVEMKLHSRSTRHATVAAVAIHNREIGGSRFSKPRMTFGAALFPNERRRGFGGPEPLDDGLNFCFVRRRL